MSRWHAVLGSLAPAVLGSPQGSLSAVGRASLLKAEGLSLGAVPYSLPGLVGGEHVGRPPAVLPTVPVGGDPGGVKPTAASRAGPHLGSEPLPAPAGPSRPRSGCAPVAPGTTQTERPTVLREMGARGQQAQTMWCPQL